MTLDPTLPVNLASSESAPPAVVKSMYTSVVDNGDGNHLLYNTLTGSFLKAPSPAISFLLNQPEESILVSDLNAFQSSLFERGFLVPSDADEPKRTRMLYDMRYWNRSRLELILLPHENCNFRCEYCYEIFARNKMQRWVRDAVKLFATREVPSHSAFVVSWFGGEPTIALDVVRELSSCFIDICEQNGVAYASNMTTNGYRLTDDVARSLIYDCNISKFQITLDGPPEYHNKRRHLAGGGETFNRIYNNLLNLKTIDASFKVIIRMNYDLDNALVMRDFAEQLADDFAEDGRFIVHFFPISKWGADSIEGLPLCDVNSARMIRFDLLDSAVNKGFSTMIRDEIEPLSSVCYAADPNSYIIGSDGTIYKCTVAFEDQRNHVGLLRPDGTMNIDIDKFSLWVVNEGVTDSQCQSCFFNPSCHGMTCPLYRMQTQRRPCPPLKQNFPDALRILAKELVNEARVSEVT